MRVVIVQPSIEDFYSTPHRLSALGGFSVLEVLEKQGHSVSLINFPVEGKARTTSLPPYARHLKDHLIPEKGPVSFFSQWKRFGPSADESAQEILKYKPDVVLISLFAWAYGEEALKLAASLKRASSFMLPIAIGGAGVSVMASTFHDVDNIDFVLEGEAEVLFKEYPLETILKQRRGNFNAKGFAPASDMAPIFSLTTVGKNQRKAATLLSRGCPRECRFCSNHLTQGRAMRRIPLVRVEEGFRSWLSEQSLPGNTDLTIDIEDDNLLMDKRYLKEALSIMTGLWGESGRTGRLQFTAENGMDYDLLDRETLENLLEAGFRLFNFSLATASRGIVEQEKRFFAPEKLKHHLDFLRERGIPSVTYFICGLKGDSLFSIAEGLTSIYRLPTLSGISLFYPVPGLPGFPKEKFENLPQGLARGALAYPWNGSLTTTQMITAFRLSRFLNLCKSPTAGSHQSLIDLVMREKRLYTYDVRQKKIPVPKQDRDLCEMVLSNCR